MTTEQAQTFALVEFLQMSPRTDVISLFDGTSSFRQWLLSKGSKE